LLDAFKDRDKDVRSSVASALIKIGTPAVINGLLTTLKDKDSDVKRRAASALGEIKVSIPDVVGGLLAVLKDKDKDFRISAADALVKIGTPAVISGLLAALKDKDVSIRAASALVKIGTPAVINGLIGALKDKDKDSRIRAASALGEVKASTPAAIGGLIGALKDQNKDVRDRAASALGEIKASTPEVISSLIDALKDDYNDVRRSAASALVKIDGPEIISGLIIALKDKDSGVRRSAVDALGEIKASTPAVISGLIIALKDKDSGVRSSAASVLVKIGTPAVISGLLDALRDKDEDIRSRAADVLVKIDGPEVISGLLAALKDKDSGVRRRAAEALEEIKADTPEVISGLLIALNDKDEGVRRSAAEAFGRIKASSPEVISGLLTALEDKDSAARKNSTEKLVKVGTPAIMNGLLTALLNQGFQIKDSTAEGLLPALKGEDKYVSSSALEVLREIKAATPEAMGGLLTALKDKDKYVRRSIAEVLVKIKANSPEILVGLLAALKDEDSAVRKSAAKALGEANTNDRVDIKQDIMSSLLDSFNDTQENVDVRDSAAGALDRMRDRLPKEPLQQLGDYYYEQLEYEKAAGLYIRLLTLTKEQRGSIAYATLLARTIEALLKSDKLEDAYQAEDYFVDAQSTFSRLEGESKLSKQGSLLYIDLLANIGSFYFKTLHYPLAKKYFDLAFKKAKTIQDREGKVEYLSLLQKQGLLALRKGNTTEAMEKFEMARGHYEKLEKSEKGVRAYIEICEGMVGSYLEMGRRDEAYTLCTEAINMIQSLQPTSCASFDHSLQMAVRMLQFQLEAAIHEEQKAFIGNRLKKLLYHPHEETMQQVAGLVEAVERLHAIKPTIFQALIDCYSELDSQEAAYWIRASTLRQKGAESQLTPKEEYYTQTTLLNAMILNKTVQDGSIIIDMSSRGKQALSKDVWESFNESERKEIRYNPTLQDLDLESLTAKSQEEIKELVQDNIIKAATYVYTQAQEGKTAAIRSLVEQVACTISKGIIKTISQDMKAQHASLLRKEDPMDRPYSKADQLATIFTDFCEELEARIQALLKEEDKIAWAKKTAAWIAYRVNLTDHFYGDQSPKVAEVLAAFVCALADTKMAVALSKDNYYKSAPSARREENNKEDLQLAEWEYDYSYRFPQAIELGKPAEKPLEASTSDIARKANPVDYYVAEANQNLERISKLVGSSILSSTSYASKKEAMQTYNTDL
jgi:HEAT repeat protein